ncbi:hypothetical protein [Aureimonas jatrophae]|uniref:Uncharacterized protein n=1 Tax=Aureimonas jatrophae TaxID=1166073 RepID=A0A1H0CN93_9HYPH|nr:hypothetical protein [Aureimonas jatrophae]MBB3949309.1 hypothetical protein [Aureimonas jatrophae]SDN59338.1 hypothetical protein SAMN05192530_101386 [Aureimonas jatrophae]
MPASTPASPALHAFEAALAEAVAAFGDRLQRSTDPIRRSAESLLGRLGFEGARFPLPDAARTALTRENERLRRAALRGDARYDLNRHIAVRRLLAGQEAALPMPSIRETRRSGAELNGRFRTPCRTV